MLDVVRIVLFLKPDCTVLKRDGSGDVDVRELVIFDDRFICYANFSLFYHQFGSF